MPARMRAPLERKEALERKEREAAAAARSAAGATATAAAPPAPVPDASSKRKETTAEKLARIHKGKGANEDFNPLHGSGTSSSAGGTLSNKKGG